MTSPVNIAGCGMCKRSFKSHQWNFGAVRCQICIITHEDIKDLLNGFAKAIELDQMRVDALPDDIFHPAYDDGMWRRWRQGHLDFINQLLPTVNNIPASLLQELGSVVI